MAALAVIERMEQIRNQYLEGAITPKEYIYACIAAYADRQAEVDSEESEFDIQVVE